MGIDPSLTCTGIIVLKSGELKSNRGIKSKFTGPARWLDIEEILQSALYCFGPELICLEGYGFMSKAGNAQAELGGIVRRRLFKEKYRYLEVAPSQVKKFASGKGNTQKEFMPLEVHKRWGVEFSTHDEVDAYVLARIAEAIMLFEDDEANLNQYTKFQQEVVLELVRPKEKKRKAGKNRGGGVNG